MMKKIMLCLIVVLGVIFSVTNVEAVEGNGTATNPYSVSTEAELREAVEKVRGSGWTYIAVDDDLAITRTLRIQKGKVNVFANDGSSTIYKSKQWNVPVNDVNDPKKMIRIEDGAEAVFGSGNNKLIIHGNRDELKDRRNNDVICVENGGMLTLDENSCVRDCRNLMWDDESAPIRVYGYLNVYGEIGRCEGVNGGAIKCIGGVVNLDKKAYIHNCTSSTEGGAVYVKDKGKLYVEAGTLIEDNYASEEGGGIFCTKNSEAKINGGTIANNEAGKSAGGVFSGYGSLLVLGNINGGPIIKNNYSHTFGGGVRCNGGLSGAGKTVINNCEIVGNEAISYGGGISVGGSNGQSESVLHINQLNIHGNKADFGGGIQLEEGIKGTTGGMIEINNSGIYNNASKDGGGIYNASSIFLSTSSIKENTSSRNGGGIFNTSSGKIRFLGGNINSNSAKLGAGIYQGGILELGDKAYVNTNNEVYLPRDHHIDVVSGLIREVGLIALINTEIKTPGTIVVDVTYSGGDGEKELYRSGNAASEKAGNSVTKKFKTVDEIILRPSKYYEGISSDRYIVLSKKYSIKYISNSVDEVLNMPSDSIGFHSEKSTLSSSSLIREGFIFNMSKSWNSDKSGLGTVYKRGSVVVVKSDMNLYAIWDEIPIVELFMDTKDRYYYVNQEIVLDREEVTSKVEVSNDAATNVTYSVLVTKIESSTGDLIAQGSNIKVEKYLNTKKSGVYILTVKSTSYRGDVSVEGTFKVYVLDGQDNRVEVRFISEEFIDTVAPWSVWKEDKYSELEASLKRDDSGRYEVDLSKDQIDYYRSKIKSKSYKVNKKLVDGVAKVIKENK